PAGGDGRARAAVGWRGAPGLSGRDRFDQDRRMAMGKRGRIVRRGAGLALGWVLAAGAWAAAPEDQSTRPLLVLHGGAGVERAGLSAEEEAAARAALAEALRAGHAVLRDGGPALDAVTAAITLLEDAPQFNAGRGAVFTHEGRNELDASLMDGASGRAGAVAGLHRVRNPIQLARAVMEKSRHVMMVGDGAEAFAAGRQVERVDPSWFRTEKRWRQLQDALAAEADTQASAPLPAKAFFGTVGALALDNGGRLAAGTSTGGMTNKRYGRVGDS